MIQPTPRPSLWSSSRMPKAIKSRAKPVLPFNRMWSVHILSLLPCVVVFILEKNRRGQNGPATVFRTGPGSSPASARRRRSGRTAVRRAGPGLTAPGSEKVAQKRRPRAGHRIEEAGRFVIGFQFSVAAKVGRPAVAEEQGGEGRAAAADDGAAAAFVRPDGFRPARLVHGHRKPAVVPFGMGVLDVQHEGRVLPFRP